MPAAVKAGQRMWQILRYANERFSAAIVGESNADEAMA